MSAVRSSLTGGMRSTRPMNAVSHGLTLSARARKSSFDKPRIDGEAKCRCRSPGFGFGGSGLTGGEGVCGGDSLSPSNGRYVKDGAGARDDSSASGSAPGDRDSIRGVGGDGFRGDDSSVVGLESPTGSGVSTKSFLSQSISPTTGHRIGVRAIKGRVRPSDFLPRTTSVHQAQRHHPGTGLLSTERMPGWCCLRKKNNGRG